MLLLIIVVILVIIALNNQKKSNQNRKIISYNTKTGAPIYLDQCRLVGYNTENGNAIYENTYDIKEYDTQTGAPIYNKIEVPRESAPIINNNQVNQETKSINKLTPKEPKKPLTEEEKNRISNTILMVSGAILIVISSIIFLASSWETVHGIIKTLVLVMVQIMFFFFAYICKNKLNIEKVSKVFTYLAYAFIPIILLALSCFEIIGDYFSIGGEGVYLYFASSFLISDILYKTIGYLKQDTILKRISYFAEMLLIIFLSIHFNLSNLVVLFIFSIYSNLMYFLLQGNYLDKKAYDKINQVISYILIFILAMNIFYDNQILNSLSMLIFSLTYFFKYLLSNDENDKKTNLIWFLITYFLTLIIVRKLEITAYFIYLIALIPLVILAKVMKNASLKSTANTTILVLSLLILGIAIINPDKSIYYLLTYIAGLILYLIMGFTTKNRLYKTLSYILFTAIFIAILYITDLMEYAKYFPIIIAILAYCIELLFSELKDKYSRNYLITVILLESIALVETYFVLVPLIFMLIYIKIEKQEEGLLVLPMLTSISLFTMDNNGITIILSYCLIIIYTIMSILRKKFNIYTIASLIAIIMASLTFEYNAFILFGITLMWSIIHQLVNSTDENKLFKFTSIISLLGIYLKTLSFINIIYTSLYSFGFYSALIATTIIVLKDFNKDIHFLECFGIGAITLISLTLITEVNDGLFLILILFILAIISYIQKWRFYLYSSLIAMIVNVIYLTSEFWKLIPWYIYILLIGLGLIIFAMFDEQKKLKNKNNSIEQTITSNEETEKSNSKKAKE